MSSRFSCQLSCSHQLVKHDCHSPKVAQSVNEVKRIIGHWLVHSKHKEKIEIGDSGLASEASRDTGNRTNSVLAGFSRHLDVS